MGGSGEAFPSLEIGNNLGTLSLLERGAYVKNFLMPIVFALPTTLAAEYESEILFRKGAWFVEVTYNTDTRTFWCAAVTDNRNNQTFSITGYDDNSASFFIFDSDWNLSNRFVDFIIDIDYSRWNMTGNADGIGISVQMTDAEKAGRFVSEISSSQAIAVYNADERRIATFSLNGSSAAITAFFDCWDKITETNGTLGSDEDPFQTSSDPFN